MATASSITPSSAQQPDLRSFIVCDRLPEGCVAFPITNEQNLPHLRPGDIAVIDPTDCEPEVGELFVMQWSSDVLTVVEPWLRPGRYGSGPNGEMIDTACWWASGANRARTNEEAIERLRLGKPVCWADGPYATEGKNAGALNRKLRGKVVGILEPAFAEPLRIAA